MDGMTLQYMVKYLYAIFVQQLDNVKVVNIRVTF